MLVCYTMLYTTMAVLHEELKEDLTSEISNKSFIGK